MIAEDEAIIRLDLKEILEEEGYDVVGETGRGDEADRARARRCSPTSRSSTSRCRASTASPRPARSRASAWPRCSSSPRSRSTTSSSRRATPARSRYLVKPFQKSDLIPAIEMALGRFEQIVALEHENADLAERLEARKIIDRAKGRLMDEHGLTEAASWRFLQKAAMDSRAQDPRDRAATSSTARSRPERPSTARGRRSRRRRVRCRRCRSCCCSTATRSRTGPSTRCPTDLATHDGHGHERGLRVHVDAREGARRREARLHRGRVRRARRQHVPQRARPRVQGRPQGDARPLRVAAAADPRGARRARDPAARGRRASRPTT